MKKRIVSIVLVLSLLVSSLSLTACGGKENYIGVGQWLALVNQTFGMESFQSTTPYFENVTQDNVYFEAVQIAKEWDVITVDNDLDVDKNLTWKEALVTLVNVGSFTNSDASDDEKVQYAIENFDDSIREYWLDRDVPVDKAMILLGTVHHKWANSTYDHVTEEITFKDGIVELNKQNEQIDYTIDGNVVIIPIGANINVKSGDIYVLPANEKYPFVQTFKAESVENDEEFVYITNSITDVEIEEIVEELFIQETFEPTMENAVVYDANGNVISVGENISKLGIYNDFDNSAIRNVQDKNNYNASQMGATISKTVKVDDVEISYEMAVDGKFDFKASIKSDNILKGTKFDSNKNKLQANGSIKISDLKITNDVDYGIIKGLKHASLKVDYKTTTSAGLSYQRGLVNKIVAPYNNANNKFLTNLKNSSLKDSTAMGAKTIKICSVDLYSVGVARVCLDVGLKISANGSISVTVTESGSKGLEYKNGNLRVINDSTKDIDRQLKGSLELTVGIGPGLYVVGLKKQIIGAQLNVGLGAEASITAHLADAEMHLLEEISSGGESPEAYMALLEAEITADANSIAAIAEAQGKEYKAQGNVKLHCDVCTDIKGYFILRISLADNSLAADLLKGKVKVSWEIFGKDNARLFHVHIDNLDFGNASFAIGNDPIACTYKYVPFNEKEDETETETEAAVDGTELNETEEVTQAEDKVEFSGEMIIVDAVIFEISVGESGKIGVTVLPNGYELGDIIYESNDSSVVSVDTSGNFKGLQEGTAMITISTKDGKFKQYCAISVWSNEEIEFVPIGL